MAEIKAIFRCKFCKAEHTWPEEGWATEEELENITKGHTGVCPGNKNALLAPHWEPLLNETCTKHRHQFQVTEIIRKEGLNPLA